MIFLRMLCAFLLSFGIWRILSQVLDFPDAAMRHRIHNPNGRITLEERLRSLLMPLTRLIAGILPVSEYRLHRLAQELKRLNRNESPRSFLAWAMVKSLLTASTGILFILAGLPWLCIVCVCLAVLVYVRATQDIHKQVLALNRHIEAALPRMVDTMEHTLQGDRDLITFFAGYRRSAGEYLGREIDVLIADMITGNQEMALRRMDTRVASASLSALIAILCGVNQGIDQQTSLAILANDLRTRERELLRQKLNIGPGRVKIASLILIGTMVVLFMVPMVMMIVRNLNLTGL